MLNFGELWLKQGSPFSDSPICRILLILLDILGYCCFPAWNERSWDNMGIKMMLVKPLHFFGLRFESILPFHVAMAHQKQTSTIFREMNIHIPILWCIMNIFLDSHFEDHTRWTSTNPCYLDLQPWTSWVLTHPHGNLRSPHRSAVFCCGGVSRPQHGRLRGLVFSEARSAAYGAKVPAGGLRWWEKPRSCVLRDWKISNMASNLFIGIGAMYWSGSLRITSNISK